jgi:TonB family protein
LQPSNILAVDGTLRLSSDHLGRTGDQDSGKPGPYAPPEIDLEGFSPPGDVWSLGMTLAEALTQKRPVWEGTASEEPVLAGAIPQPLLEIARNCLRRNPRSRWKTADIEKRLGRTSPGSPAEAIEKPAHPAAAPKRLIFALSAVLTVILAFVLFGPRIFSRVESTAFKTPPSEPATAPTKATPPAPVVNKSPDPPPAPAVPVVDKQADKQPDNSPAATPTAKVTVPASPPPASTPLPESKPKEPEPAPAATAPSTESIQKVMPDVNGKARASIHGRVRVTIRVRVDATGKVLKAEIQSQGPSKYFADAALQSSRRWKFPPGDAARAYDVQYIFERSETTAVPARVAGQ